MRLSSAEQAALDRLEEQERGYRRGSVLIAENDRPRELFVVRSGWLHSSVVLGNGSRQIMCFHFQSDLVGQPLLALPRSPETVTAVTDAVVSPFSRERLAALIADHPRLAALILALIVADRVSLADRLASVGRTSARARVSSLLCEIQARLRALGLADGEFQLPLTQEEIGDATGLTAVHVNRMMRRLVEDGIIERNGSGHVRVLDEPRLCADASFSDRSLVETGWLPAAR